MANIQKIIKEPYDKDEDENVKILFLITLMRLYTKANDYDLQLN